MIFSHGLGGSRNAYSHLVGSIASHGIVVIAPEHRDGSSPISYIRDVPSNNSTTEKSAARKAKRTIEYVRLSHTPSPEVEAGRNTQLKVRLWELGAIHSSLLAVDGNASPENLNTSSASLSQFVEKLDVHRPGKLIFAGHSFGATTVTQFIKSTFYSPQTHLAPKEYESLFIPSSRSPIVSQITPETPLILLDIWCLPLRAASTRWLWNHPFPCYSTPSAPGGAALLAVESQAFYKWRIHLKATKQLLSPDPTSNEYNYQKSQGSTKFPEPNFFYADSAAHLSQSDFGVLFPWVTKKMFGSEEPERVMKLNVRAILQLLRSNQISVSPTSVADMELGSDGELQKDQGELKDDLKILSKGEGGVRGWNWISTNSDDLKDVDDEEEEASIGRDGKVEESSTTEPAQAVIGNELLKQNSGTAERL